MLEAKLNENCNKEIKKYHNLKHNENVKKTKWKCKKQNKKKFNFVLIIIKC